MGFSISPNLPANVVEIGNELSQARLDAINNGSSPTSANPFVTVSYLTGQLTSYITTSTATSTFAPKANPTFTGTVTIPAGANISGYLTTASAAGIYQSIAGMSAYLTDAPNDGSEYVRKNNAWSVATGGGGGGGGIPEAPIDGSMYARLNAGWASFIIPTVPAPSVTNIDLTGNFNGYSMGSGYYSFKYDSTANTLRMQDGVGNGTTLGLYGLTNDVSTISISTTLDSSHRSTLNVLTGFYTITVPNDGTFDFPLGTKFFICSPAGSSVDCSMTGVTLNGTMGGTFTLPLGVSVLVKVSANTWYIS